MKNKFCWTSSLCLLLWPFASVPLMAAPVATLPALTENRASFSLPELVNAILLNNPALEVARSVQEQAGVGITTAAALPNPRLEWSEGRQSAVTPSGSSGAVTAWGLSQLIENPSLRRARMDAASHVLRGSEAQSGLTRSVVAAQVRERAYEYLLRIEEAQAAREALALLEQMRERVRVRVGSGEAGRYEIIKADAEFSSDPAPTKLAIGGGAGAHPPQPACRRPVAAGLDPARQSG